MDIKRTPGRLPHRDEEEREEGGGRHKGGGAVVSGSVQMGGEIFGTPDVEPTFYHCPAHGDVLAQDVVWKRDGRPYCPECGHALELEES
jgi:hypothetical protein